MSTIKTFSKETIHSNVKASLVKKRSTFWQMIRCILRFGYRPSIGLLLATFVFILYCVSPINLWANKSPWLSHLDELILLFIYLKILSNETHRYARFKAKNRRACGNH